MIRIVRKALKYIGVGVSTATVYGAGVLIWNHEISPRTPLTVLGLGETNPGRGDLAHLQLHQFGSCPFCCKVRTYLEFYGFSYDLHEVDPLYKWRSHKGMKLPSLKLVSSGDEVCIDDSSAIISILHSYLVNDELEHVAADVLPCYPAIYDEGRGKMMRENKYHIMYGNEYMRDERREESKWRKWVDEHLVHTISPNVYRTWSESVQTFHHFADLGDWNRLYGGVVGYGLKYTEIYLGALAMYLLAKRLKKKYKLDDDVRKSLYKACDDWCHALQGRKYMGGIHPNLADLAVYGSLRAFEGCQAFEDTLQHTNIGTWYMEMKLSVLAHGGHQIISK